MPSAASVQPLSVTKITHAVIESSGKESRSSERICSLLTVKAFACHSHQSTLEPKSLEVTPLAFGKASLCNVALASVMCKRGREALQA